MPSRHVWMRYALYEMHLRFSCASYVWFMYGRCVRRDNGNIDRIVSIKDSRKEESPKGREVRPSRANKWVTFPFRSTRGFKKWKLQYQSVPDGEVTIDEMKSLASCFITSSMFVIRSHCDANTMCKLWTHFVDFCLLHVMHQDLMLTSQVFFDADDRRVQLKNRMFLGCKNIWRVFQELNKPENLWNSFVKY